MTMTPDELDACRVFLAAYRRIIRQGRIEVWVREAGKPTVRIVHTETVTASATIPTQSEAR